MKALGISTFSFSLKLESYSPMLYEGFCRNDGKVATKPRQVEKMIMLI